MNPLTQTPANFDSRSIDPFAYQIVKNLQKQGFVSYLVGGCVRDILLGKKPKDFDIATNASPQQVKRNVNNAFIIGRRFRIVLVKRGDSQFEVTTFRRDPRPGENLEELPEGDNLFGSPEEDAKRRDFTINALFYDPVSKQLIDYASGMTDLEAGIVRMIGDPNLRLVEDPIRILRGIRLAQMIRFHIDLDLREAMRSHAHTLLGTALPRRREEILKFLRLENPAQAFLTSIDLGVLKFIAPELNQIFETPHVGDVLMDYLAVFAEHEFLSPQDHFSGLIGSLYFALRHSPDHRDLSPRAFFELPVMEKIFKDELNIFKSEQMHAMKALQLTTHLPKRREFEKRGPKRRDVLLSNEAFPLALHWAEKETLITGEDLLFWKTAFEDWQANPESSTRRNSSPARRRPRRRRRR